MVERKNVLFLCTGNSARSILAEGLLQHLGGARYQAFSAGSKPAGAPHCGALAILAEKGIDTGFAHSKSWDVFASPAAPQMDLIITVCGNAAGEVCPVWPGHPNNAHWGIDDPAAASGEDAIRTAFATASASASARLCARISAFAAASFAFRAALAALAAFCGATRRAYTSAASSAVAK